MDKLNFGCGPDIKEGWDNADIQKSPDIQKSFDFNKFPYPLKKNQYKYVYISCLLEHIDFPEKVLNELWKSCKNDAIIEIIVPYYNNKSAYVAFDHIHFFSEISFYHFVKESTTINKKNMFDIGLLELVPTNVGQFIPKRIREKASLFLGGLISYVHVKLKVVK